MKRKVTAGEFMAKLNADPEFVARSARREAERAQRAAELQRAERPLAEALREAGWPVESVWDLVNTATPYPSALPVLFDHLQRSYPDAVREGVARALAVREAKVGWAVLTRTYLGERSERVKDGLAVALAAAADREAIDSVIDLVRDTRNGPSRILLLSALSRSRNPRAMAALVDLQSDTDLKLEIAVILRRRKRPGR